MAAVRRWIEDSQLDGIRLKQPQNLLITGDRVAIVDEHADTHAAIGSPQQVLGQHAARLVTSKNIILKVEGSLRGVDHLRAGSEPVRPDADDAKCRFARMLARGG